MEFGALMMFRNPQPWRRPIQDVYRDLLDLYVLAEKLGFDHLWTSEHHFLDDSWTVTAADSERDCRAHRTHPYWRLCAAAPIS